MLYRIQEAFFLFLAALSFAAKAAFISFFDICGFDCWDATRGLLNVGGLRGEFGRAPPPEPNFFRGLNGISAPPEFFSEKLGGPRNAGGPCDFWRTAGGTGGGTLLGPGVESSRLRELFSIDRKSCCSGSGGFCRGEGGGLAGGP